MNIIAMIKDINLSSELFGKYMAEMRILNINMSLKNAIILLLYYFYFNALLTKLAKGNAFSSAYSSFISLR
jgi:hypothetical protein